MSGAITYMEHKLFLIIIIVMKNSRGMQSSEASVLTNRLKHCNHVPPGIKYAKKKMWLY